MSSIMFQGVCSGAGKSTVTALFCRYLAAKGKSVAPFKALNLSLNSFVTRDGKEMGMAQAFQAIACGIEPRVEMNPILLKPSGNGVIQLVLEGKPYANFGKGCESLPTGDLMKVVGKCYNKLLEEYDTIIIEGSGSPAEINLFEKDIANMRTAELAKAPVILIGDIDRGGVFAALYGTYYLLNEHHKKMVRGFIINRFRGDPTILQPGIREIEKKMRLPCLGVIPMIEFHIPQEDSLSLGSRKLFPKRVDDIRKIWISSLDNALLQIVSDLDMRGLSLILEKGLSC
ncbi:MAG: cobyric acid synthase [Methanomassiliicoccales archaeon]